MNTLPESIEQTLITNRKVRHNLPVFVDPAGARHVCLGVIETQYTTPEHRWWVIGVVENEIVDMSIGKQDVFVLAYGENMGSVSTFSLRGITKFARLHATREEIMRVGPPPGWRIDASDQMNIKEVTE